MQEITSNMISLWSCRYTWKIYVFMAFNLNIVLFKPKSEHWLLYYFKPKSEHWLVCRTPTFFKQHSSVNLQSVTSPQYFHFWRCLTIKLSHKNTNAYKHIKIQKIQIQIKIQTNTNSEGGCCCFIRLLRLKVSLLFHLLAREMPAGSQEFGSTADLGLASFSLCFLLSEITIDILCSSVTNISNKPPTLAISLQNANKILLHICILATLLSFISCKKLLAASAYQIHLIRLIFSFYRLSICIIFSPFIIFFFLR